MFNERIKELAEQTMNSDPLPNLSTELYCFTKSEFENFVELVINESIEVMIKYDYHGEWLGEKLKAHFGVEE